jgi:large subunit ribosomal protein L33
MAKSNVREKIHLACETCKRRNYSSTKNKRKHPDRVEYRKYCRHCRTHTPHKETR